MKLKDMTIGQILDIHKKYIEIPGCQGCPFIKDDESVDCPMYFSQVKIDIENLDKEIEVEGCVVS